MASPHCQLPPRRLFPTAASPPSSQALRAVDGWEVDHLPGCSLPGTAFAVRSSCAQTNSSAELIAAAAAADVVVACLGEDPHTEKPGDLDDLSLDAGQLDLVRALNQPLIHP